MAEEVEEGGELATRVRRLAGVEEGDWREGVRGAVEGDGVRETAMWREGRTSRGFAGRGAWREGGVVRRRRG